MGDDQRTQSERNAPLRTWLVRGWEMSGSKKEAEFTVRAATRVEAEALAGEVGAKRNPNVYPESIDEMIDSEEGTKARRHQGTKGEAQERIGLDLLDQPVATIAVAVAMGVTVGIGCAVVVMELVRALAGALGWRA